MDPDYFTRRKRRSSFFRLYRKIVIYGFAVVLGVITLIVVAEWDSDSKEATFPQDSNSSRQVLAESDSLFNDGGVIFSIPTTFSGDASFNANVNIAQNTNIEGDLYYRGELINLSVLADEFLLEAGLLANILEEGIGISIEIGDKLILNNTGVLSFNGLTGDVKFDDVGSAQNIFKNILVPGGTAIKATSNDDSLTFIPGTGITLTTDSVNKSITITSSLALSTITNIFGTTNQVIVSRNGSDITLSLPQAVDTAAKVKFSEIQLANPANSADMLMLTASGRISMLNNKDLYLGGDDTGNIRLTSKGSPSLLLDGPNLIASGSLSGVTDLSVSGNIEVTSFGNGVVQSLGYTLSSGPVDLSKDIYVTDRLLAKHGGTGTDKIPTDGQILIGSGLTGEYEPKHLGTGNGISISRGPYLLTISNSGVTSIRGEARHVLVNGSYAGSGVSGDIALTLPQIIDTTASPTFANLKLTSSEDMITFGPESGNRAYLTMAELTSSRRYTLPNESGTFCLTSGNCVGLGGGLVGSGTANYIAKFSDSGTLTNSVIYDNGERVGIGTVLPVLGVTLDINGSLRLGVAGGQYDILNTIAATGDPSTTLFWGNRIICDSSGSCGGDGGIVSNGSNRYLALFTTGGNTLDNSLLYDTGSAIGVGTTSPSGYFEISGDSGSSALVINQTNSLKDILTASIEGNTKMILTSVGDLDLLSGVFKHQGVSGATVGGYACVMTSGGIVTGSGACPKDPSADLWDSQSSVIFAKDTTRNFALGGTTVNDAKFAVLNINSGDPTIWLRSSPTRTLSITSSGTIKTINNDDITLDAGRDVILKPNRNLELNPGSGEIITSGKFKTPDGTDFIIEPAGNVSIRPRGYEVMHVSTEGVGINTALSRGVLTIKERSSFPTPHDEGGGGTPDNNLILNPADSNFSSNTGNWTLWSGWSISGGRLTYSGGIPAATLENQYIGNFIQAGKTYTVQFDLVETTSPGSIGVQVGNAQSGIIWADMPPWDYGTKTTVITPSASGNLHIYANNGWQGSITNIRITSPGIEPPPPASPPPDPSGPGLVIVSSDGSFSPLEMRAGGSGLFNSFVGYAVGGQNLTGINNAGFGANALIANSSGNDNSAFGFQSLNKSTTASFNSAFGSGSMLNTTIGAYNSAFGADTLSSNTTGTNNAAVGYQALNKSTTASYNSALGSGALFNTTTGEFNTAIGALTLNSNTTGANNAAVGYQALNKSTTAGNNSAFGSYAMHLNTTGGYNSAFGSESLYSNLIGTWNVAVGYRSLNNYTGSSNTAIGSFAMYSNKTGSLSTAVGYNALYNSLGSSLTAVGNNALYSNTTGINNVAVGVQAARQGTTGIQNVSIGDGANYFNTTGGNNTALGFQAGYNNISGGNNTFLGASAGYYVTGNSAGNVFIGANAGPSISGTSFNKLYISNASGNPLIWGDFLNKRVGINLSNPASAINTLSVGGSLCVTATGVCGSNSAGTIYTTNTVVEGADLAENYVSSQKLVPGDVVSMAENGNSQAVVKAVGSSKTLLGVVSTTPGVTLNSDAKTDNVHKYISPIALSGRVPTKVSTANGNISVGDALTVGSTPGVAVKATTSGYIIGRALEAYSGSGVGTIVVYASSGWHTPLIVDADGNVIPEGGKEYIEKIVDAKLPVNAPPSMNDSYEETLQTLTAKVSGLEDRIKKLEEEKSFVEDVKESKKPEILDSKALLSSLMDISLESASISGALYVGVLKLDAASINSVDRPLKLQANSTENVEVFNGAITFAANGDIVTTGSIRAKKIEINTDDAEAASIGVGKIPEGEKSVTIETKAVTDKSNIFITPKTVFSGSIAVTEQNDKESFKVEIEKEAAKDIEFSWWIVN